MAQARWVISRFGEAGTPGWRVPGDGELREHFDDHFLSLVPAETIVRTLTGVVSRLREELIITMVTPLRLRAQIGGMQLEAAAAADPPHRLTGPVVERNGPRGTFSYSNGGYALLGQLIADMTGSTYPEAAAGLVLGPLGMSGSSFPASWPADGRRDWVPPGR